MRHAHREISRGQKLAPKTRKAEKKYQATGRDVH